MFFGPSAGDGGLEFGFARSHFFDGEVDEQEKSIAKTIHDDIIWLNENRSKVAKGVPALENIVDELTGMHMKTLYKLENLR